MLVSIAAARRTSARLAAALVLAVLALVAAFSWSSSAVANPAYPPSASCVVSTGGAAVTPGSTVTVTGSGFAGDETVSLTLKPSGAALGTVTTSSAGSFQTTVAIPPGTSSNESIVASGADQTCSLAVSSGGSLGIDGVSATSSVAGVSATSGIAGVSATKSGGLAFTGFQTLAASAIGLALLAGGLLLVLVGRRRRA